MVSIIIVNYHVRDRLFVCIKSILTSKPKVKFEIIVVDNDEEKTIKNELNKKFPQVIYVPNENKGFGEGNNAGAKHAKGEYLFFLNPDTVLLNNSIDLLINFLEKKRHAAVVSPLLFDKNKNPYKLQGDTELNPLRAIFVLSFINKIFPENKIYKDYYLFDWDKKSIKEVDTVPGTAFVIRKKIFENIGGFDEKFFLYFEEFDLCKRVRELGYKIVIIPGAKVLHHWGLSTRSKPDIEKIFRESRFYYFKKHFGFIPAVITELILRINKFHFLLLAIILIGLILRLYRINETMPFIHEQGWFYLSARDLVLNGNIPLVGIASSHPWLHQGAYWTYMLAGVSRLAGFNPINGAYLSVALDIAAILLLFKLTSNIFNQRAGIIATLLYATSPLIIFNARMPYHTSPIPLFTILFIFSVFKWVGGHKNYFPVLIISLACLYNLELATMPFWLVFLILLIFGFWKKKKWTMEIFNKKILLISFFSFLVLMMPVLIYDAGHNFPQTFGFIAWIGYRILVFFGYPPLHPEIANATFAEFMNFTSKSFQQLIFPLNIYPAIIILSGSVVYFYKKVITNFSKKIIDLNLLVLAIIITIPIIGFIAIKTPSQAYLPMLFPEVILLIVFLFFGLSDNASTILKQIVLTIILAIGIVNCYYVITFLNNSSADFIQQENLAKELIRQSGGKEYNLVAPLNYEYMTWYLGHGASAERQTLIFKIDNKKLTKIQL